MTPLALDVGCGKQKRGDIGVDYSRNSEADVIADAHYLLFKDKVLSSITNVCRDIRWD